MNDVASRVGSVMMMASSRTPPSETLNASDATFFAILMCLEYLSHHAPSSALRQKNRTKPGKGRTE